MKNPSRSQPRKGFTLVELLVVIAIIAVLAAAGFSVGTSAMNKARKLKAQTVATSISNAIDQFYTEYSSLPDPKNSGSTNSDNTSRPFSTTEADGKKLLEILSGLEEDQNERKIRFLSLKESSGGTRDGAVYGPKGDSITGLYDPWGEPYYIVMDYDYDERLEVNPHGGTSAIKKSDEDLKAPVHNNSGKVTLNGRRAAVYSLGVKNVGDANSKTLVKTW